MVTGGGTGVESPKGAFKGCLPGGQNKTIGAGGLPTPIFDSGTVDQKSYFNRNSAKRPTSGTPMKLWYSLSNRFCTVNWTLAPGICGTV